MNDLISHCLIWPYTFPLSAPFLFLRNDTWIKVASYERKTFFGKIPVSQSGCLLLEEGTIYVYYSRVRMGGWVYFDPFLLGFYRLWVHFFFNPSPPSFSHSKTLVERFRCLRINYFNLALTLIGTHTHPAATHLPLQPTFEEQPSPQTFSFLINFFLSTHLATKVLKLCDI